MSEAAAPEAKPKKKKKKGLPLKLRLQLFLASLMEVSYSAKSEEKEERVMARVAVASTATALFLVILGVVYVVAVKGRLHPDEVAEAERLRKYMEEQAALAKQKKVVRSLGVYQVEIKRKASEIPQGAEPGAQPMLAPQSMAEFELVVECDIEATCNYLDRNTDLLRSEINAVLLPVEREEIITRDGRDKIKKTVLQRLNAAIPTGHLEGIYFTTFMIN
jgi:hypothetical protein